MSRAPRPSQLKQSEIRLYALRHPITREVRYVGKTVYLPERRLTYHLRSAKSDRAHLPSARWLAKLLRAGSRAEIEVLEIVSPREAWAEREKYWIAFFRAQG